MAFFEQHDDTTVARHPKGDTSSSSYGRIGQKLAEDGHVYNNAQPTAEKWANLAGNNSASVKSHHSAGHKEAVRDTLYNAGAKMLTSLMTVVEAKNRVSSISESTNTETSSEAKTPRFGGSSGE